MRNCTAVRFFRRSLPHIKNHENICIDLINSHPILNNSHPILINSRLLLVDGHQCRHRRVFLRLVCGRRFCCQRIQSCLQLLQGCQATSKAKFSVCKFSSAIHSFPTVDFRVVFHFSIDFPHVNLVQITLLSSQLWTSCSASFWSAYV